MIERKPVTPIFKFERDEIDSHIKYELNLFNRIKKPLDYVFESLEKNGYSLTLTSLEKVNLKKVKFNEGKSYNWCVIKFENVKLMIRSYQQHLTIFTRAEIYCDILEKNKITRGAFTFHTDFDRMKLTDKQHDRKLDFMWDNPLLDLNKVIKEIFEHLKKDKFHWLDNSASLKLPDGVKLKQAYEDRGFGEQRIYSFDLLTFCFEEINSLHVQYFAENTMFEYLPELKKRKGDFLEGGYDKPRKIKEVITKLKDNYYHGVGVVLEDESRSDKTKFEDVYSLTRYFYEGIFGKEKEEK